MFEVLQEVLGLPCLQTTLGLEVCNNEKNVIVSNLSRRNFHSSLYTIWAQSIVSVRNTQTGVELTDQQAVTQGVLDQTREVFTDKTNKFTNSFLLYALHV